MARLNSEETLWTVLPVIVVMVLLIAGIIFLPKTNTDVRSRASEPKPIITPVKTTPTKTEAPEVVCSDLYSPVCGSDGNTYPNSCEAGLVGVTKYEDGQCPTATPTPKKTPTNTQLPKSQMQYVLPTSN